MLNLTSHSLNIQDESTLQQLEIYLQHLSQEKKASLAIASGTALRAIAALYEATEPDEIYFDYVCTCCSKFNKSIALLQDLSKPGLLAVARALTEELAVLEQLQGASR